MIVRPLSASELLTVWEQAAAQPPVGRALALLAASDPETPPNVLAALPIGRRDGRLLHLRARTLGATLESMAECPLCAERVEISFEIEDIMAPAPDEDAGHQVAAVDDYRVTFRLPHSFDLLALPAGAGVQQLLARCVLAVTRTDSKEIPEILPDRVVRAVAAHMAVVDPQADVQLALTCPACGHAWTLLFDIASFFWQEIEAWALRTLHAVHTLAAAYSWREQDILAMGAGRRQLYLQMVTS